MRPTPGESDAVASGAAEAEPARSARGDVVRMLLINAVAPYIVFVVCKPHTGEFAALALSAVPPTVESLWSIWQRRRLDVMAALVLGGIAVSLGLIALGGSERVLLLRESFITSLVGVLLAGSVFLRRPLLYLLARQMSAGDDPTALTDWEQRWQHEPGFRRSMRIMSAVWGIGLVGEMAVRTAMVYAMRISDFLLISPFVQYGLTGALVGWTVLYTRRMRAQSPS